MRSTRKLKRKRGRRLKKWFKIFLGIMATIVAIILIIVFGFKLQTIETSLDLGQFTNQEVRDYIGKKNIDNTFVFWFKNKIGKSEKLEMFEDYSVKLTSPTSVKITGYEKKLKGCILDNKKYYYFDENGIILKESSKKIEINPTEKNKKSKKIPEVKGLQYSGLKLYKKIETKNNKGLQYILDVTSKVQEYSFTTKKIVLNEKNEITFKVKKVKVQLGKNLNLDKKLKDFNDMHKNVIKYSGTLNMKHASEDGSYTLKKSEEKSK